MQGAHAGLDPGTPGSGPGLQAGAKPRAPQGSPQEHILLRNLWQVLARHWAFLKVVLEEPPPPAEGWLLCCWGPESLAVPGFDPGGKGICTWCVCVCARVC